MANYDTKLGEWFRQVEQRAKELRARKQGESAPLSPQDTADTRQHTVPTAAQPVPTPRSSEPTPASNTVSAVSDRAATFPDGGSSAAAQDRPARTASPVLTAVEDPKPAVAEVETPAHPADTPALFDEAEIPQVEDFLSFLNRAEDRQVEPLETHPPVSEMPVDRSTLTAAEGTGTPRPITVDSRAAAEPAPPRPEQPRPAARPKPTAAEAAQRQLSTAEEKWARVPQHLHVLFDQEVDEVAQHSYKTFKESRADLIQRLLDPTITLEDAARILNVCPTTVRRYTNRGILKHYRTAGNQRRFKLSDVLAFMESRAMKSEQ